MKGGEVGLGSDGGDREILLKIGFDIFDDVLDALVVVHGYQSSLILMIILYYIWGREF